MDADLSLHGRIHGVLCQNTPAPKKTALFVIIILVASSIRLTSAQ